jgi:hypothetical protein
VTPSPVLELIYIQFAPNFCAQSFPSSVLTYLSNYKSFFAPTIINEHFSGAASSICANHLPIFLKEFGSLIA